MSLSSSSYRAVTFSASLQKLTVATFGDPQKADFCSAVLSKATGATSCTLSGIRDGSLMLNSEVTFPQSGANARTNADSFSNVIKTSPSSVFPADTYGNVTVTDVKSQSSKLEPPLHLTASHTIIQNMYSSVVLPYNVVTPAPECTVCYMPLV